jgi:hypothetical protein
MTDLVAVAGLVVIVAVAIVFILGTPAVDVEYTSKLRALSDSRKVVTDTPGMWTHSERTEYEPDVDTHSFRGSRFASAKHSPWRKRTRNIGRGMTNEKKRVPITITQVSQLMSMLASFEPLELSDGECHYLVGQVENNNGKVKWRWKLAVNQAQHLLPSQGNSGK